MRRVVANVTGPDTDELHELFVRVLGMHAGMDLGWIVTYVSPSNPTAQVSVSEGPPNMSGDGPHLTVELEDVDAAHERTVQGGLEVSYPLTDESWGVRRFFVRTSSGLVVNVMAHSAGPVEPHPD